MTVLDLQVDADADSGFSSTPSGYSTGSIFVGFFSFGSTVYNAFSRFTGITGLGGSSVSVATYDVYVNNSAAGVTTVVRADDSATPTAPTSYAEAEGKTRTSAGVSWNLSSLATGEWHSSPSIVAVIQEIADSYNPSAIQIIHDNDSASNRVGYRSHSFDSALAPKLYIELSSNTAPDITAGPTVSYASGSALTTANSPADVDFTVTDAEETGAGEIDWEIRTATGGGGTLVTSGTATSGIGETAEIAWNDPGIVEGAQTLYLLVSDGTDTDEESFSLTVDLEQTISAATIASSLQLHNATLTAGEVTINAAHIDSGLQLHNATLTTGAAALDAAHLDSTLSLEPATITTTVTLDAAHLDSTLVLHDGVATADGTISGLHLDSTLALYNATVIFDQTLEAAHLDTTVTLHEATTDATVTLDAAHIASTLDLHTATLTATATIDAASLASTLDLHAAEIEVEDAGIAAEHLASTLEMHLATLTPGAAEIAATLLDNEVALYGAGVLPGAATLDAAHLALTGQLHDAQVVPGAATVDALHLASMLQMYPATMGFGQTLTAALLDISVVLYPGTFLRPVPSRARLRDRTTYYRLADRTDEYRLDDRTTRYRLRKE